MTGSDEAIGQRMNLDVLEKMKLDVLEKTSIFLKVSSGTYTLSRSIE